MECEQGKNVATTKFASKTYLEKGAEGSVRQGGTADTQPASDRRTDAPDEIIRDLFHYLRRTGDHGDLVANLKTLQANFSGEDQWIEDFHKIIYDAWQTKELGQGVALTFMGRTAALFAAPGMRAYSPSTGNRIANTLQNADRRQTEP